MGRIVIKCNEKWSCGVVEGHSWKEGMQVKFIIILVSLTNESIVGSGYWFSEWAKWMT